MDLNKLKQGKINVNSLFFLILVLVYCTTATDRVGSENSIIKYIILILCILESQIVFLKRVKNGYKPILKKEFKCFFYFVCVIIVYSIFRSICTMHFSFRTVKELLFLVCPMIYGYLVINTFTKKEIDDIMKISFGIVLFFYILSLGLSAKEIINSLLNVSFSNSSSKLESHIYCGLALAYFVYFCYYNSKKTYKYLSLLFVFMTFKRLSIVMSLFLLIFSNFKIKDKFVKNKICIIAVIGLVVMSVVYYQLVQPQNVLKIEEKYNINMSKLTSTRTDRLRVLLETSYQSYGFGSSTEYMYKYMWGALEMDIVKIIIELGYLPVIFLISSYLYFSRVNYYTFSYMTFHIMNLIFSSSLTSSYSWIMAFVTIGIIWKDELNKGEN